MVLGQRFARIDRRRLLRVSCIGSSASLTARTTASPIRRMRTSMGMAGGSLADDGWSQELAVWVAAYRRGRRPHL